MDPLPISEILPLLFQLLPEGIRALRARDPDVVESAIAATSKEYPSLEIDAALRKWAAAKGFDVLVDRLQHGERDVVDYDLVRSFIQEGEFYLPEDEELHETAESVVSAFVRHFLGAMLQGQRRDTDAGKSG